MLKGKRLLGLGVIALAGGSYHQYHYNNSFRSVTNLLYAGTRIAYIYKFTNDDIVTKNNEAALLLRDALKANGGIYLKLGQLIATLDVIVPDEYRLIMSTLTRQCRRAPYDDIRKTIEEELGYPMDVLFQSFERQPISSASIAQVHRAKLIGGQQVAVKVQHRDLAGHIQNDLKMMHWFSNKAKKLFDGFAYEWLVQGFDRNIRKELDFRAQAANMERTRRFLIENEFKQIYVPKLELQPSQRVLVMEFIEGVHIDQVGIMKQMGVDCKKLGKLFSKVIIKMIHKEGFVHADTHTGNLMVRKVGKKAQLVLLDHGIYQELDDAMLHHYNQFWLGLILNDPKHYEPAARALGTTNPKLLCSMLTSKTFEQLDDTNRKLFDLNPGDRAQVLRHATERHFEIVGVLGELKREMLLLMKVNEFARSIENMMSGRQMGVYQDIARECVMNMGLGWWGRWAYWLRMLWAR